MFWRKSPKAVDEIDSSHLVWLGNKNGESAMEPEFHDAWMQAMDEAFWILGMTERLEAYKREGMNEKQSFDVPDGFVPIPSVNLRRLLQRIVEGLDHTMSFLVASEGDTRTLRYKGSRAKALEEWKILTHMLRKTTVIALATDGFRYYLQGTQVGYDKETRHLFNKKNTLERLGTPIDPIWRANVSGYTITILGSWKEIIKTRQEMGLNILQMLQLRTNQELLEAMKQER